MLGSPILYPKGIRILMFQLSGFYYKSEDDCKALVLFISISKEKSNTNAQYNWVFKLDKRAQFTPADAWVECNLGMCMRISAIPGLVP